MPQTPHVEKHFTSSETVRDIVIGMSDGLTVPFALAAGLSGAVQTTGIIITAGMAEVAAGATAMGLGGYLAARTDAEHFASERDREERETVEMPEAEAAEVAAVLRSYGLDEDNIAGGMVPLAPYFFRSVHSALIGSVIVTLLALLVFGYIKGRFTTARPFRSAWQTVVVGGLAATAAFVIAKAIG
jgi:vacuolar iron transporter family protein